MCLLVPSHKTTIWTCPNGHNTCLKCRNRVTSCPICRSDGQTFRNKFAEEALLLAYRNAGPLECPNIGCSATLRYKKLSDHGLICKSREVPCPAKTQGACNWVGQVSGLVAHISEAGCCVVSRAPEGPPSYRFAAVLGAEPGLFNKKTLTRWKPVLAFAFEALLLPSFACISRDPRGTWILYVRTLAEQEALQGCRYTLTVSMARASTRRKRAWSHVGTPVALSTPEDEVLATGNYLRLLDCHVRPLGAGREVLAYTICMARI